MPSQAMRDVIGDLTAPQKASASQPPPALEELRAGDSAGGGLAVAVLVALQDPFSTPAPLRQLASGYLAGADPRTPLRARVH